MEKRGLLDPLYKLKTRGQAGFFAANGHIIFGATFDWSLQ